MRMSKTLSLRLSGLSTVCTEINKNSMIYIQLSADVHQAITAVLVQDNLAGNFEIATAAPQCLISKYLYWDVYAGPYFQYKLTPRKQG